MMIPTFLVVLLLLPCHAAFVLTNKIPKSSRLAPLYELIVAEDTDFDLDQRSGGVRLAEESVLFLMGTVQHSPGSAKATMKEFKRYKTLSPVVYINKHATSTILATGVGVECYHDPGETTEKRVDLAPVQAIKAAKNVAASCMSYDYIHINFAGTGEMQITEVLRATEQLVLALDIATKAKIEFLSITSDKDFVNGTATVTVVGRKTSKADDDETEVSTTTLAGKSGVDKAVAQGIIVRDKDGKFWTVSEDELETRTE
jgi:hypothetical protein